MDRIVYDRGLMISSFNNVVLLDQGKSLNWKIRNAEFCDKLPEEVVLEILKKLETLLKFNE